MKISIIAAGLALLAGSAHAQDGQSPLDVIESSAEKTIELMQERQEYFRDHPDELEAEVRSLMDPVFDIGYSAKLVLGKAGRDATPDQRVRFARALRDALIAKYADGLMQYDRAEIEYLPFKMASNSKRARVRTRFVLEDGRKIPVDYLMHQKDGEWKAYDISIEGISYVTNYRNQFGEEIAAVGLDKVIDRLENVDGDADAIVADGE